MSIHFDYEFIIHTVFNKICPKDLFFKHLFIYIFRIFERILEIYYTRLSEISIFTWVNHKTDYASSRIVRDNNLFHYSSNLWTRITTWSSTIFVYPELNDLVKFTFWPFLNSGYFHNIFSCQVKFFREINYYMPANRSLKIISKIIGTINLKTVQNDINNNNK